MRSTEVREEDVVVTLTLLSVRPRLHSHNFGQISFSQLLLRRRILEALLLNGT